MAGAGFKTFSVGDVLTASDVNGYLMSQAVMNFASSGARGSAIGTATEGMVSYLADTDAVEVYDGSAWVGLGGGGFTASTAITVTDASWSVPTLADPIVRITAVGGGGGGLGWDTSTGAQVSGSDGTSSSFACSAGTVTGGGGNKSVGGRGGTNANGPTATSGLVSYNAGRNGIFSDTVTRAGADAVGGSITIGYLDLTGVSTANVTIGAGGAGGSEEFAGSAGGAGVVIVEYRAG